MQFQHTLGCGGAGVEGDPLLERHQQGACHPRLLSSRTGFSNLWMEELCSGSSEGERRCDLSAIP